MNSEENMRAIYRNIKSIPSYSSKIAEFLRRNENSSLFRQVRHNYPRRRIRAYYPYHIMMSDTINYRSYAMPINNNYKYIMVLVDVFSKRAWAEPMKRINEFDATIAMENMLRKLPDIPQTIITDKGTEYYNSKMKNLFDRMAIKHYSIRGKHKACVAERFIRTLKGRLEKYFWAIKKHKWIDVLQQFIQNYNETFHRSIKMAPNDVNETNRADVFKTLYPLSKDKKSPRLSIGDLVRLLKPKTIFNKGYAQSWTKEIYKIEKAFSESAVDFYTISDREGNILPRNKYYWELNLVSRHDN
jgi:hypothetical protein